MNTQAEQNVPEIKITSGERPIPEINNTSNA